ncbi:MAG TPA: protein kinase [Thermoanaerobaculia bacterium]|nr:protein kinase [Thermoanaerobaculia bacterium]
MSLSAGTKLGRYEIRSKIGQGGMGEVYLAQDTKLDRKVALKVLRLEVAADQDRMRRFVQEAKTASALNHPNIVTIHEIDQADSVHFMTTEFIDGETLRQRMRRGALTLNEVLDVAIQIASALSAAHAAGIVHRDIKPENVMLRHDGIVKTLDFGIAKLTEQPPIGSADTDAPEGTSFITERGVVLGTDAYLSPEQARSGSLDGRSDIWSLGVVLYEMVAGRLPFEGETSSHVIVAILERDPAPLARFAPGVPPELQRIVRKCLAKKPDERYQTARDLMTDLRNLRRDLDLQGGLERSAAPHGTGARTEAPDRESRALTQAIHDAAPRGGATIRPMSSAEYVVTSVQRHKARASVIAALIAIAVAASILFLRPRGASSLTEKDTILLTDVVNTTGDPVFDGTLKQALAVQLGQSPFLDIFSEERVRAALRFMGRSPDERVTRDVGREICQRQGLKAMLLGSIASLGSHYVITLEATNALTSDAIAREQVEAASKEQVLHSLGQAAAKLRGKLGEVLQSVQRFDAPIEQATTSSLEAFKAFSLGVEQQLKGKYLDAIPFLRRATEIDPTFALAYARMASTYYNSRQYDLAAEASQKAFELRERVSERERFYISAGYYDNVTGELEKYLETLELWKRTYPRNAPPHNNLALKYNELGQFEKALGEARDAIRLNPNSASGYSLLASAFVGLNRFDEAKETVRQALERKLETTAMHNTLYRIAFAQRDAAAMKEQIEALNGKPDEYLALIWQAEAFAFSGRLREAREFTNRAVELAAARDLKDVAVETAARAAARDAQLGDCGLAGEQSVRALGISRRQQTMIPAASALAICGEPGRSQTIVGELARRFPTDTILNKTLLPLVQAQIELQRGNPAGAIPLLEQARPYEGYALFQVAYLRGQAYLNERRGTDAASEFQKILDHRGSQVASYFYPLAHLGLARAAVLEGETAKARKAYQDLFALWKDADADMPILIEAKKEYAKLKVA